MAASRKLRWAAAAVAALVWAVGAALVVYLVAAPEHFHWDFRVYDRAAHTWLGGGDAYAGGYPVEIGFVDNALPFVYPPIALLAFAPFTLLPEPLAILAWLAIEIAAAAALLATWRRFVVAFPIDARLGLLLLFGFNGALYTSLASGNIALLEALALYVAFDALLRERPARFAALVVAAAAFKILPLVFLPCLVVWGGPRRWRALIGAVLAACALAAITAAVAPAYLHAAAAQLDERRWTNPTTLAALRDLADRTGLPIAPTAIYACLAAAVLAVTAARVRQVRPDPRTLVPLLFVVAALVLPRFKSYSYVELLPAAIVALRACHRGGRLSLAVLLGVVLPWSYLLVASPAWCRSLEHAIPVSRYVWGYTPLAGGGRDLARLSRARAPARAPRRDGLAGDRARLRFALPSRVDSVSPSRARWLVVAIAVAIYVPSLTFGRVDWDDKWLWSTESPLRHLDAATVHDVFFELDRTARHPFGSEYLPVRDLAVGVDMAVWGHDEHGPHATQLALFALTVLALGGLLVRFGVPPAVAWLATLLWAVHPIHVESVAWLSERKGVLAGLFFVVCGHAWVRYRDGRSRGWLVLAAVAAVAATWSKAPAMFGPVVLAAWDLLQLRASPRRWFAIGVIGLATALAALPVVLLATEAHVIGTAEEGGDRDGRLATAVGAQGHYVQSIVLARPLAMSYPINSDGPAPHDLALGALAVLGSAGGLAWWWRRQRARGEPRARPRRGAARVGLDLVPADRAPDRAAAHRRGRSLRLSLVARTVRGRGVGADASAGAVARGRGGRRRPGARDDDDPRRGHVE